MRCLGGLRCQSAKAEDGTRFWRERERATRCVVGSFHRTRGGGSHHRYSVCPSLSLAVFWLFRPLTFPLEAPKLHGHEERSVRSGHDPKGSARADERREVAERPAPRREGCQGGCGRLVPLQLQLLLLLSLLLLLPLLLVVPLPLARACRAVLGGARSWRRNPSLKRLSFSAVAPLAITLFLHVVCRPSALQARESGGWTWVESCRAARGPSG